MPEQKMVDIDTSGNPVDVDIDSKEEEQQQDEIAVQEEQQDTSVREVKANQEDDSELDDHSDKVQKRIDKLTAKMREAERREQAALEYAEGLKKQYADLDTKYKKLDDGYLNEFKNRVEVSKTALQDKYAKAVQAGDVKAQVKLKKN